MHNALMASVGSLLLAVASGWAGIANAGGGQFVLGYGPTAHQSAGTSAAVGFDGFSGASNPGKLSFVDDRVDVDLLVFMPDREIERRDSDTPFDFKTKSRNGIFFLPEFGYARRLDPKWSWGVALYGNGGLNTEYHGDTGVPETNANPAKCGDRPGNFFAGCGKIGFDLTQLIVAPTLSWQFRPGQSVGIAPLLAYQRFKAYGFQAFEAFSQSPDNVSNRGYDDAFGGGVRVGWFGRVLPWLDAGAAYSSRIYLQKLDKYKGLIADEGKLDVPANLSVGIGVRPSQDWTIGLDVARIFFRSVHAYGNGVQNSINDPAGAPLGSENGTGFHWDNNTIYRGSVAWNATPRLTTRVGIAYGKRPYDDGDANTSSLNLFAPNPHYQWTAGFTYLAGAKDELHLAYGKYVNSKFSGESATGPIGIGGTESVTPDVDTIMLGWSRRL
jgi:long-chain fatty acid transport protein